MAALDECRAAVMEPRKGLGLCLAAAALVRDPAVRFLVVGDGPEAEAARWQARRLGVQERVTFLGRLPWRELQELYRSAHVFLFTAVRDSYGTAPLEALAAGAPLICLDHQGAEVHLPEEVALRIPLADQRRIAGGIARAVDELARDRGRLERMSQAARRYAETEAWDTRAAVMQQHYEAILRARGRAGGASAEMVGFPALAGVDVGQPSAREV